MAEDIGTLAKQVDDDREFSARSVRLQSAYSVPAKPDFCQQVVWRLEPVAGLAEKSLADWLLPDMPL